ncbi:MAG TPA: hypothetical protein ENG48_00515 [Candidatus Atribacteria bacterium]|nr:hypothetical protein [Candidatus Atribacteria bacterium]
MKRIKFFTIILILIMFTLINGCSPAPLAPVITSFLADPQVIDAGGTSTLTWEVSDATTVTISPGVGSVALIGTFVVSPIETTTYTLTASNVAGNVTAQVNVTVSSALQKAIDVVVDEILPDIPEVKLGKPYWCLKLDDPLPPGTLIVEDSGTAAKANLGISLEREMFFFYLDLAPGSFYAHPVKYILVDEEGNHEEYDAEWWPKIGGEVPELLIKEVPEQGDIIAANVEPAVSIGTIMDYILPELISQWTEGFIVVQGLMPTENLYSCAVTTYLNGVNFFNAYKNAFSDLEGLVQSDATQVLDTIEQMAEEGKSVITIYIIAHGNVDYVRLGGQSFTANQFKNKMAEFPDVIFNFILGSCHSGSFIDNLSTLSNVCAVETACASDEGAYPDYDTWGSTNDVNPSDTGSEFTSSIIAAMVEIASDSSKMSSIQTWASTNGVPVTSMLICQGGYGAVGAQATLGLTDNLDICSVLGWSTPSHYCSYEFPIFEIIME